MEPQAEKKEPPSVETPTEDRGSRSKGYKGGQKRFIKKKSGSKDVTISKSKFKGAIDALLDYYFDTGPTQAHDFKKTHKKIATYVGTKYSAEAMMSIEEMKVHDWTSTMPRKPLKTDFDTVKGSTTVEADKVPQEHLDRYDYKMKSHCKREDKYEVDMSLCFTVVHGQCTDDMLHELKCQQKYDNIKSSFDPIGLLKLIQQISYNYQAQDFALMAIAKAQEAIYVEKQSQTESNIDYLLTFKNRAVVLEAVGGNLANDGVKKYMAEKLYSKEYDACTDDQQTECTIKGREAMLATVFLMKADKGRYSKLLTDLHDDHLKGYKPYPHDLADAQKLLLNYSSNGRRAKEKREDDDNNNVSDLAFAQESTGGTYVFKGNCHRCGKQGHKTYQCPDRFNEEKNDDKIKEEKVAATTDTQKKTITGDNNYRDGTIHDYDDDYEIMFCQDDRVTEPSKLNVGVFDYNKACNQVLSQMDSIEINPWWVLLDNCSTVNIFSNKNLLRNIRQIDMYVEVKCNAGSRTTNWIGDFPGLPEPVWFDKNGRCNILSMKRVKKFYHITYDSDNEHGFIVTHRKKGTSRSFYESKKGLHFSDFKTHPISSHVFATTTVKKQKEQFSKRDVKRAVVARKLHNSTGPMSLVDYISAVSTGQIKNCPVTPTDIKVAEVIFGPNVMCLRGKTARSTTKQVRMEPTPIPLSISEKYRTVTLAADIMFVRGYRFFVSVSEHIAFGTASYLKDAKIITIANIFERVCNLYRTRGFRVTIAMMDGQFEPLQGRMPTGVQLQVVSAEVHVGLVERFIRTTKERTRCTVCVLPYVHYPFVMVQEIVAGAIFWLNVFPPKGGVSKTFGPRTIVMGTQIDFNKHCTMECGQYVETHEPHNNNLNERTCPAIFLRPNGNEQGGAFFMSLRTGQRLNRQAWTELPMPDTVISTVHALAKTTIIGMPFQNRNREEIESADVDQNPSSTGVIDDEDDETETETDDDDSTVHTNNSDDGDKDNTNGMPGLEDHYDSDSDDEDEDDDEDYTDDEEQSTGVSSNDSTGVEVETVEEDDVPEINTKGVPKRNTTTRTRRIQQTHLDSDFVYTNYSSSLTMSQSHITRTVEHIHAINSLVNYGKVLSPGIKNVVNGLLMAQQYHVNKGLKVFGERGREAVMQELKQLDELEVISPRNWGELTPEQRRTALPYLMFLTEKRDESIKARGCADGSKQEMSKENISAPVISTDALFITLVIDAMEGRDVATVDIPGAFLQTEAKPGTFMKITGPMVDILCQINPKLYEPYVTTEKGKKVLYTEASKAIYGMVDSAFLFWLYLSSHLAEHGFVMNPYDVCCMNKVIDGKQCTIVWHVDDLKVSHMDAEVVSDVIEMVRKEFGNHKPLTVQRGLLHDYLGMTIDLSVKGKVMITMIDFIEKMLEEIPEDMDGEKQSPARDHLFQVNEDEDIKLEEVKRMIVHRNTAKLLFLSQRARPDVQTATSFLCTRVKEADTDDYKKLARVMQYLRATKYLPLILGADGSGNIYWYQDGAHAVHRDMRGHTGLMMTFGQGAVYARSLKQKLNTRSSTETELVAFDDGMPQNIWAKYFTKHQGRFLKDNISYQDNTSTIRMEKNGKMSTGKMTKHINIRYFFCTDRIKKGELSVEYCPTLDMIADYFTKALQGSLFRKLRDLILGIKPADFEQYKRRYEEISIWRKQKKEDKDRKENERDKS
jgi:hypothetical protein